MTSNKNKDDTDKSTEIIDRTPPTSNTPDIQEKLLISQVPPSLLALDGITKSTSSLIDAAGSSQIEAFKASQAAYEVMGKLAEGAETDKTREKISSDVRKMHSIDAKSNKNNNFVWAKKFLTLATAVLFVANLAAQARNKG